jgi:hypothetical protein
VKLGNTVKHNNECVPASCFLMRMFFFPLCVFIFF